MRLLILTIILIFLLAACNHTGPPPMKLDGVCIDMTTVPTEVVPCKLNERKVL